jgi:hypothetical protein
MKRVLSSVIVAVGAVLLWWAPSVSAQQENLKQTTTVTFNKPTRLPGLTLSTGSYIFEHLNVAGDRHIVQVFSPDHEKIYATLLTVPDERLTPAKDTIVTFRETPEGAVDAVRAWFYPGEKIGDEFIYQETEATGIAKATHGSVLTEKGRINEKGEKETAQPPKQ